jgi:TM2 domain-containing membrane protein YozV
MPPPDAPNRVLIAVLAILLGWTGIHKFMLGMTTPGIITLVISLCTFGSIGSIIGLVEGIIYLTKTDDEFYQTYVVEKKQWF